MFKNGMRFEVVGDGIIGEITGLGKMRDGRLFYYVAFYDKVWAWQGSVLGSTIENNIRLGKYKVIGK